MINDPLRSYDGFSNLVGGVDGGRKPNLIDKIQCAEAYNIVFREGAPTTRPAFRDIALTNISGFFVHAGLFQEASYYAPSEGNECIMASVGGRLFKLTFDNGQTGTVSEIDLARLNRSSISLAYHLQAGHYFIVQDGESAPIIFDGVAARRAGTDEIFTGKMMAYGMGRIVMVGSDNLIYFGDIYDGKGNGETDVLGFTETQFLNEGFPSALPSPMGVPTAVQFLPLQDTATGVGECLVFGQRGVESFFLSIPRDQWKASAFQRTALLGTGCVGHRAVALVNQDIWFRAHDGWRSYRQARAQQNEWAQIPQSSNVRKWVDADTPTLLDHCSAINFQNRLIGSCTPYTNQGLPYHNGLLTLDFDILSTFGKLAAPAWDGHWGNYNASTETGLRALRVVEGIFKGRQRAFVFTLTAGGLNHVREIVPAEIQDDEGKIKSVLRTRSMDFGAEMNEKMLYGGDLWIENVQADTNISVNYRADQMPDYSTWRSSFTVTPTEGVPQGDNEVVAEGFSPRASLPKPADDTDTRNTNRILRRFYELQAEIIWTGRATMRKMRAQAQTLLEDSKAKI